MKRHFMILLAAVCIFGFLGHSILKAEDGDSRTRITTQEQAAEFASMLANEKCQKTFAKSPFAPDSYAAVLLDSRWYWGKIELPGINSFSAEVGFNTDGSDREVRVVYHLPPAHGDRIIRKFEEKD